MLSNYADAFFMTPMKLKIHTQATNIASGMPAPRPLSASATKIVNGTVDRMSSAAPGVTGPGANPMYNGGVGGFDVNSPAVRIGLLAVGAFVLYKMLK